MFCLALRALVLILAIAPAAWAGNIVLALSDTGGPYAEFSSSLSNALDDTHWKITTIGKADSIDPTAEKPDLIITVGSEAFHQVLLRGGNTPLLATLLPRQSYEKTLAESGKGRSRVSAIYLDQPPARQALFLRNLLPGQKRIGMLFSSETKAQAPQFRQAFASSGLVLDSEESEGDANLVPAVNTLLPRVGALLAIPDSLIYRRDHIKAILISSYRYQKPVIAFSMAFVNAGALAALYSTPAQIARQVADQLTTAGTSLPAPMPPSLFSIAVNHNVAQALGLSIQDENVIRRAMLADRDSR